MIKSSLLVAFSLALCGNAFAASHEMPKPADKDKEILVEKAEVVKKEVTSEVKEMKKEGVTHN